jgi:subtilisin family serine protease
MDNGTQRKVKRRFKAALTVASVTAAAVATTLFASPVEARTADILGEDSPNAISGEYIVALKDMEAVAEASASALVERFDGRIESRFDSIGALAVHMSAADAARLAADPAVDYVEQNSRVELAATQLNPPGWGLDRVDQRALPLDASFTYPNSGAGVHAYIIDTGIWLDHADFAGRLDPGYSAIVPGGNSRDCHGHGTHVAGTVGGTNYGVAKQVQLVPVQVFNCLGTADAVSVIGGVEWVTENAVLPAVATMSLGGTASQAMDTAVEASVNSGVSYSVAAGNNSADACGISPARVPSVMTVAATDSVDVRGSFSNFGTCVDLFAPGVNVRSDYLFGVTTRLTGTSIATPHVAGAAAVYLAANPTATPATVAAALTGNATNGAVIDPAGSPNKLLFITT